MFQQFGGNPVACTVGLAVLEVMDNENLMASSKAVGKTLLEDLAHLKNRHEYVGDVRGLGLCIGVEVVKDKLSRKPDQQTAETIALW